MKNSPDHPHQPSLGLAGRIAQSFIDSKLTLLIVIASLLLGVFAVVMLPREEVGIVPLAPQPDLCWYWADPYMYRGYWDYCY